MLASFLGWMLDAFDYFLLTFVIVAIAQEFHTGKAEVTYALFLTLAARPLGALLFGRLADRFGRRPILMLDVVLFSVFELATAFCDVADHVAGVALPVRHRDGRGVGHRRVAGDGVDPGEIARR